MAPHLKKSVHWMHSKTPTRCEVDRRIMLDKGFFTAVEFLFLEKIFLGLLKNKIWILLTNFCMK